MTMIRTIVTVVILLGAAAGLSMAQWGTGAGKVTAPGPVLVQNASSEAEAPPIVSTCGCPILACANGTIDACYVSCDPPKKAKCTCHANGDPSGTSGKNSCSC